jgi:hypothetical protein
MHCSWARRTIWLCALLLLGFTASSNASDDVRDSEKRVQAVVDDLAGRLGLLPATVATVIVPSNPLLVSVEPDAVATNTFVLSFEERFLDELDDEQLRAVVAHELGHVWIFTHHPYLQTERLANSVAMRVVPRQSLEDVYSKVWERRGTKGDIARFLGQ